MATAIKKGGKKWYMVYMGFDKKGEFKQIWKVGFKDKAETQRQANILEERDRRIKEGYIDPQADARAKERAKPAGGHLASFRAHMEANARHPNHIAYTIKDIERCLAHTGAAYAAALTIPLINAWRNHCLTVGYPDHRVRKDPTTQPTRAILDSRKTVNRRIASVKAWLRYLVTVGGVDRCILDGYSQLDHVGHEAKRKRRAMTAEEVKTLLEKCPDAHRREIYRFALLTGFRRSEVAAMTPGCFDFQNRKITISAKDAKTKSHNQTIDMHPSLVTRLKELCIGKLPGVRIFHVPNRTDVVPILHKDCEAAGVDSTDVDFHSLRHTFCSLLAEQGVAPGTLKKMARHQDIQTTMRYYVHVSDDNVKAALAKLAG